MTDRRIGRLRLRAQYRHLGRRSLHQGSRIDRTQRRRTQLQGHRSLRWTQRCLRLLVFPPLWRTQRGEEAKWECRRSQPSWRRRRVFWTWWVTQWHKQIREMTSHQWIRCWSNWQRRARLQSPSWTKGRGRIEHLRTEKEFTTLLSLDKRRRGLWMEDFRRVRENKRRLLTRATKKFWVKRNIALRSRWTNTRHSSMLRKLLMDSRNRRKKVRVSTPIQAEGAGWQIHKGVHTEANW